MRKRLIVIALLATLMMACNGCSTTHVDSESSTPTSDPIAGRLTFAGSTSLQPLVARLGESYQAQHPKLELDIAAGGSGVGIQAIHDGAVDIGMASRALRQEEVEGIEVHQIAIDALAVIVHTSNPVDDISQTDLHGIYTGAIVNWRELGGSDEAIVPVAREQSSGTRGAFDTIVLEGDDSNAPGLQIAITAGDVAALVSSTPAAIGYVGFGNLETNLKAIRIDDIEPSVEAIRNGTYTLIRPLQLLTGPLSQPLASSFVEFALSEEGQKIVVENGWVNLQ
jgi:phosphate transport system substrate-binding protein